MHHMNIFGMYSLKTRSTLKELIAIFILQNSTNNQVYGNKIPAVFSEIKKNDITSDNKKR
jgi:hypothetical protein